MQFNCGYWVIERQLADLCQVFQHVGSYMSAFLSAFLSGFYWACWPIYAGFFVMFFFFLWVCGAHLHQFLAGLLAGISWLLDWVFVVFGL